MNGRISSNFRWEIIFLSLAVFLGTISVRAQDGGFTETFDDPALPGWERTANAEVVDGVLRIHMDGSAHHDGEWGDMILSIRASLDGPGFLVISYRISELGEYSIHINAEEVLLHRAGEPIGHEAIEFIPPGEWFFLEVISLAEQQEILLNGQHVLAVTDPEPLPPGGIALGVQGDALGWFDDLTAASFVDTASIDDPDQDEPAPTEETAPAPDRPEILPESELTWVRTGGPPGGIGYDIRYKFDELDTWLVTDNFAGVHISTDNGLTWQTSNTGIPGQLGPTGDWRPIFSLTIDPHNSDIVWAGTDKTGRIYKSIDGGRTWEQKDKGVITETSEYDALTFRGFTIDPNTSNTVYAMGEIADLARGGPLVWSTANGGVVYRTIDGGENWELIWDGGIPSSLARYMWINPENTDILYVSTGIFDRGAINEGDPYTDSDPYGGLGILKSTDGGDTWRVLNETNGLDFLYIGSLFMHPDDPDVILAAAGKVDSDLYIDYLKENNLRTKMGIYRTTDGGETWTQVLDAGGFNAVEICPSDHDVAYAGSAAVVYRSEDAGVTWTQVAGQGGNGWGPPGVLAGVPIDFQCDPRDPNRIFSNNYVGGNFLSEDGGKTWTNASDGYTGAQITSVVVDPNDAAQIYVAGRNGIWASRNGGGSWYGLRYPPPGVTVWGGEWGGIAIDPADSQHLLVSEETIWESYDGGSSWEVRRSPAFALAASIVFAPSDTSIVYTGRSDPICMLNLEAPCTEGSGVYISEDGGSTWDFANDTNIDSLALIDLAVHPTNAAVVYAATQRGLFKTENSGASWAQLTTLPEDTRISVITIHPQDARHLMAGVDGHGLYISEDSGQTWQQIAAGLQPNSAIRDIIYDPTDAQVIYLSDLASGIYRSVDGGQTWTQINNGLTTRSTTGLGISSDGLHVYTATSGEGVFRLDISGHPPDSQSVGSSSDSSEQISAPEDEPSDWMLMVFLGIGLGVIVVGVVILVISRRRRLDG